jgi:carbonic anhydrase/acetyltransferase-like protein (isoleucine patch superfamily)
MPLYPYRDHRPRLGKRVFIAPTAALAGDIEVGDDVSFWFSAVARADVNFIRVGAGTNVQDGAVLHVNHGDHPLLIGENVVIGHGVVLHGCTVGDGALIGIGAQVLDGAVVEAGAQIGAGAVVTPGKVIPAGHLALGIPARPVRPLSRPEVEAIGENARRYVALKDEYLASITTEDEARR